MKVPFEESGARPGAMDASAAAGRQSGERDGGAGRREADQARTGGPRGRAVTTSTRFAGFGVATTVPAGAGGMFSDSVADGGIAADPLVQPVQPGQ